MEPFPYGPITDEDRERITILCGGAPPQLEGFKGFLQLSGLSAIPEAWYRTYLRTVGWGCLDALGIAIENPRVVRDMDRGVLFYAGTLREAGNLKHLPHNNSALAKINGTNRLNLGLAAEQDINNHATFYGLLHRFKNIFSRTKDYDGFKVALIGAGVAHVVIRESLESEPVELEADSKSDGHEALRAALSALEADSGPWEIKDMFDATLSGDVVGTLALSMADAEAQVDKSLPPLPVLPIVDRRSIKLEDVQ